MRKALPLIALVALAAGCGGRAYSDADIHRAFRDYSLKSIDLARRGVKPGSSQMFATLAAVTELRLDPGTAIPAGVYVGGGIEIMRFRSAHDAWIATRAFALLLGKAESEFPGLTIEGLPRFTGRRGNVVVFVLSKGPDEARARSDFARLH